MQKVRGLGRKPAAAQQAPDPARRGWALMMSDEEFAKFKQTGSTEGPAPGVDPEGGTPSTAEGGLFDFSGMLQNQGQTAVRVPWQRSATTATKQSRLTGMPLLFFVTHRSSRPAQDIEQTMMLTPAFRALAQENLIPVRIDFADQDTNRSPLYRDLKERLNVRGYPVLVLTLPDGTEVTRLTGYKSEYEKRYLETLQNAVERAVKLSSERRAKLEQEGYRSWKNKDGKPVFAKLTALDANMGTFTGEWGESFKTFLTRLNEADQAWIAERRK